MPDALTTIAQQLIEDGNRDREALRRRWNLPSWRAEVQRIANLLERNPLLIPAVQQAIEIELTKHQPTEATSDDDRQEPALRNLSEQPPAERAPDRPGDPQGVGPAGG